MTNEREPPVPLLPGSMMWRDFGSYVYHLMLPQAFVLQSAHPTVAAAVAVGKKYKRDPWARARDSRRMLWPMIYARPAVAVEKGLALRELHERIRFVDADGTRKSALDREAYAWVHMTGYEAAIRCKTYFRGSISTADRKQLFDEWKQVGALLGIARGDLPSSDAEFFRRFDRIVADRLEYTEVVRDLLSPGFVASYPVPPSAPELDPRVWKAMAWPISVGVHALTVATLPPAFREKFGIPFSAADRVRFRAFAATVRVVEPRLPERRRYISLARRAFADAREHPEAYVHDGPAA